MQQGPEPPDRRTSWAKAPPLFVALASLQKSDGTVEARAKDSTATVTVVQGRVVEVVHERTSPRAVVDLLVYSGVLTPEDVARARSMARGPDTPVDAAVRAAGFVGEATLANAREFLCHEVLMDWLLRLDVEVSVGPITPGRLNREICAMPVRFVLREAQKRATEMPAVRKVVPSDDLVFVRTATLTAPGEARRWADLPLSPAERQVFVCVNGERTIAEIARVTGQSCYKVARAIKTLLEMDLVRPRPAGWVPGGRATGGSRSRGAARMVRVAAAALLLAALVRVGVAWWGDAPSPAKAWAAVTSYRKTQGLAEAARLYGLIRGRPPVSLDELKRERLWGE